jgi:hypothetical protein
VVESLLSVLEEILGNTVGNTCAQRAFDLFKLGVQVSIDANGLSSKAEEALELLYQCLSFVLAGGEAAIQRTAFRISYDFLAPSSISRCTASCCGPAVWDVWARVLAISTEAIPAKREINSSTARKETAASRGRRSW